MGPVIRLLFGVGLLALGYYVGREVGRSEAIQNELLEANNTKEVTADSDKSATTPENPDS